MAKLIFSFSLEHLEYVLSFILASFMVYPLYHPPTFEHLLLQSSPSSFSASFLSS